MSSQKMERQNATALQQKNLRYNWHAYTQHKTGAVPIVIKKGKEALLWDENGKEYIDAIGSWWANPHGHANEKIANAITQQINTLEHVLFGGFTHPKAIELSEKLVSLLPENQAKVFYSDNGSTAVEVGIKMALQSYLNKGEKKDCVIAFEEAFHGDTFAAMAVSDISFFTQSFKDFLLPVEKIPIPNGNNMDVILNRLDEIFATRNPGAFIYEPLVQGAAGMRIYTPENLDQILKYIRSKDVKLIADEVMTGFGRTGKLFATDYSSVKPDIMCFSKALTGGFIPLSATTCTQEIYDSFLSNDVTKALFHGHTFMANPAGCAAALSSIELTLSEETQQNIQRIHNRNKVFMQKHQSNPKLQDWKCLGIILRFKIITQNPEDYYSEFRNEMYDFFIEKGIILRPISSVVYLLPPYCITDEQLDKVYSVLEEAIEKFAH